MSLRARVDSMKAQAPAPTRTALPAMPNHFPFRGRYLGYILFGSCGFFLLVVGLLILRAVWVLGSGDAAAWQELVFEDFANPIYLAFHALALIAVVWFALRFFRLFPKTQPPKIGPFPRPPDAFFAVALHGALIGATIVLGLLLWGAIA